MEKPRSLRPWPKNQRHRDMTKTWEPFRTPPLSTSASRHSTTEAGTTGPSPTSAMTWNALLRGMASRSWPSPRRRSVPQPATSRTTPGPVVAHRPGGRSTAQGGRPRTEGPGMIPELIGAVGLVFAAVITGIFHRMRRENDAAHGESIAKLEDNGRTTARSTRPQVPFCATGRAPPTKPSAEHFRAPDPLHYASHVVRDSDVMGRHC
jgi:hypothetical protein